MRVWLNGRLLHETNLGEAVPHQDRVPVQVIERGAQQVVFKASQPVEKVVDYPAPDLQDGAKVSVK